MIRPVCGSCLTDCLCQRSFKGRQALGVRLILILHGRRCHEDNAVPGDFVIQPLPDSRQIGADDSHAAGHRFHQDQGQALKKRGQHKNIALIHRLGKLLM